MNTDKIYAEAVANEYSVKDTSKAIKLKKLDAKAKLPATIFTYSFGVVSALILGVGMCLAMRVIGDGYIKDIVLGILIGVVGIVGVSINYPIYKKMLKAGKSRYPFPGQGNCRRGRLITIRLFLIL